MDTTDIGLYVSHKITELEQTLKQKSEIILSTKKELDKYFKTCEVYTDKHFLVIEVPIEYSSSILNMVFYKFKYAGVNLYGTKKIYTYKIGE